MPGSIPGIAQKTLAGGFNGGKGFRQQLVGAFAFVDAGFEFIGFSAQLGIGEAFILLEILVDLCHDGKHLFDFPAVLGAEDFI